MIVRHELGRAPKSFELGHYRVVVERAATSEAIAEATVKLRIGEAVEHRVAEGDGPVDALNRALRLALEPHFPSIKELHLIDYKVRVINSRDETAAKVRVIIEFRADGEVFGTIGVDENIIDASWRAIVDAYEYHLNSQ
jgi:2-isopropylmalate synthase